jgi:MATE family multidrug resistance protein
MGIHRPAITLYASLCGQVVNIVANYALIFGKWGMPQMGIAGAAWGTFIGMGVAALINMAVLLGRNMNVTFRTRGALRVDFAKMYDLLKVGLPAGIGVMANVALWGVVLFTLVGKFGTEALAATSAALTFTNLSVMPIVGVATALAAAVGKSIGAGRKEMAARHTSLCLKIALLYMGTVGVLFFVFRETLMTFWSSDERVIQTGAAILVCAAFYQVFHAARVIYAGALQGAGDTLWLAGISTVGAVGVLALGGALTVRLFPSLGAIGPWIAATVSIVVVGVANRWRFKSNRWMRINLWREAAGEVPIQVGSNIE